MKYKKIRVRPFSNYHIFVANQMMEEEGAWVLSIPFIGWFFSAIAFTFIYPLWYWLDYKVVYKKIK